MSATPSWDDLASFLVVMRGGSLSAAARVLGVTQPTVRRQIENLEAQLDATLFTRSPSGLIPTPAAIMILPFAEAMRGAADALTRAARSERDRVAGTVRVTCSEIIAAEVAPAILAPLLRAHPALTIEVAATDRTEDLLRRDADVAVRMTRPTQAALVARRVGDIALGLFADRSYLAGRTLPVTLADLANGHVIVAGDRADALGPALVAHGVDLATLRFALRADSSLVQLASVRAGLGVGVCQVGVALRSNSLVAVCPDVRLALTVWIVMHEDLRDQPRVRIVYDHLVEGLTAYAAIRAPL